MSKLQAARSLGRYYLSFLDWDLAKVSLVPRKRRPNPIAIQLKAAGEWICRAQDAFVGGGVASGYSLVYHPYFRRQGWIPAYPETTGYIIPTIFDYAGLIGNEELFARAVRMADWEKDVQMENGAVQGGTIDQIPTPAVFNTGQVIFGWLRCFQETQKEEYLDCALKAGRFLIAQQDEDGAWRKNLSNYASSRMDFYTYNTRTAWALLELHALSGNQAFRDGAVRNIDFSLSQQLENGWFQSNCLENPSQPLLHTIAYCIRGILEAGVKLNNGLYIDRARKAAAALLAKQRSDGSLSGRFNNRWEPTVAWSCLTGDAQISVIWGRLFQVTGEERFLGGVKGVNEYLMGAQLLKTDNPGIYGGIAGSDPLQGGYRKYEILSWATKFFMDALMLQASIQDRR